MPYDPTWLALRRLYEKLWDPRSTSDGAVRPSRDKMQERQELRWPDDPGAWKPKSSSAAEHLDSICTRFKQQLKQPLDPRFRLHDVVHPMAEFVVSFDRAKPFGTRGHKGLLGTSLHDCCKFAGCPPPPEPREGELPKILHDQRHSERSQIEALAELLYDGIGAEISGDFATAMKTGRVRAHRARKRRRAAISRAIWDLNRI